MAKARLATNIDEEMLHQFKIQAAKENKKINELLEIIIAKYLKENK
ncbi:hypothetical protein [Metabacillus fastidiosus]